MGKKKDLKIGKTEFPPFCDYSCKYAAFSDPAAVGACRKELGVWCKWFKRYNNKSNKCFGLKS